MVFGSPNDRPSTVVTVRLFLSNCPRGSRWSGQISHEVAFGVELQMLWNNEKVV
jgi:hypothetical protein